jgi:hypothetical protein
MTSFLSSARLVWKGWKTTRQGQVSTPPGGRPRAFAGLFVGLIGALGFVTWGAITEQAWAYVVFLALFSLLWAIALLGAAEAVGRTTGWAWLATGFPWWKLALVFLSYGALVAERVWALGLADAFQSVGTRTMLAVAIAFATIKVLAGVDVARAKMAALRQAGLASLSAHERMAAERVHTRRTPQ